MKKLIIFFVALFAFYKYIFYIPQLPESSTQSDTPENLQIIKSASNKETKNNTFITSTKNSPERAFQNHFSRVQVTGIGTVDHILRDDNKGLRHQKFILRLPSGQTLLVAHNIDISQRLNGIQKGDSIEFQGQYEWNPKGGVLHWTHHDPRGRHKAGWLQFNGHKYQ